MSVEHTGSVEGKVAIVTGSGNGLGETYARALADAGAAVVVADIHEEGAQRVVGDIEASGGRALAAIVDTTSDDSVAAMVEAATAEFGGIDILVNNAGWRPNPLGGNYDDFPEELTSAEWLRVLAVNVVGPMICAQACRPSMAARGGGVIVNQSSNAAYLTGAGPYGVSKAAVNGLTISLAQDYAADGIRVNAIAPGMMTHRMPDEIVDKFVAMQILQRRGAPEDLIGTLLFLCSEQSSFITGQTILVDGGQVRRF